MVDGLPPGNHGEDLERPAWLVANQLMWDERARVHADTEFYDLQGLIDGDDHLRPWEDEEMGPIDGLDVIHLQCHIGTDTVGLARRGARVVGLDLSPDSLAVAADLAKRCDLAIDWVESDVYTADTAVGDRRFDLVYTGFGALNWLPDLGPWAEAVAGLLRPGGFLYLTEIHPMWVAMVEDGRTLCQDTIDADLESYETQGTYADVEATFENTLNYERLHSTGDLLSALLDAGLRVELYHEYDRTAAPSPWMVPGDDRLHYFPEGAYRFPVSYSLRARLPRP